MASIAELKRDGIGSPIDLRIIRKWRHDVRRHETWFVGVDRFVRRCDTDPRTADKYYIESVLNVSDCYTISDYNCPELDKYQKVLENDFYIDVGLSSVIKPIPDTITIPTTWFRFVSKPQLLELGEHPPCYPDFIGMLSKIRDCTKHDGQPYVLIILTDSSGDEIPINLWRECITNATKFNRSLLAPPPAMTVVAVTNLKPYVSAGSLRHGSSHATHVYVNPQIPETRSLMNLYSGPNRPSSKPSGIPATLKDIRQKKLDMLDKTFLVRASITEFMFQDSWYQMTCPTCRDPIFKRGPEWYCSAHSKIEKPLLTNRFSVTITDSTGTIPAIISDTSFRKLLNMTFEDILSDNTSISKKSLPQVITQHKGEIKTMSIQMLRTSSDENLRFIIIDIEMPTTLAHPSVPVTPSQPPVTRSTIQHNASISKITTGQAAKTLTFNTDDEPAPSGDIKRIRKK
ncbi:unnamed protein product [Lactuca virosa]|uniref:Replication factor A C-terminal domain-containing protein n=1 Tax=Lactuca virosa TaxID=75947 RepID=A0AAU9LZU2_9ASTR|nr:unnamed protein product [Lactuca virosa]